MSFWLIVSGAGTSLLILANELEKGIIKRRNRVVYSGYRVNFELGVLGRLKIGSSIHFDFYIILNSF